MLRTGFEVRGLNLETAIADLDKSLPFGRIAQPEDIADVVLFLASDSSRYMCGSLVEETGGKAVYQSGGYQVLTRIIREDQLSADRE